MIARMLRASWCARRESIALISTGPFVRPKGSRSELEFSLPAPLRGERHDIASRRICARRPVMRRFVVAIECDGARRECGTRCTDLRRCGVCSGGKPHRALRERSRGRRRRARTRDTYEHGQCTGERRRAARGRRSAGSHVRCDCFRLTIDPGTRRMRRNSRARRGHGARWNAAIAACSVPHRNAERRTRRSACPSAQSRASRRLDRAARIYRRCNRARRACRVVRAFGQRRRRPRRFHDRVACRGRRLSSGKHAYRGCARARRGGNLTSLVA